MGRDTDSMPRRRRLVSRSVWDPGYICGCLGGLAGRGTTGCEAGDGCVCVHRPRVGLGMFAEGTRMGGMVYGMGVGVGLSRYTYTDTGVC